MVRDQRKRFVRGPDRRFVCLLGQVSLGLCHGLTRRPEPLRLALPFDAVGRDQPV